MADEIDKFLDAPIDDIDSFLDVLTPEPPGTVSGGFPPSTAQPPPAGFPSVSRGQEFGEIREPPPLGLGETATQAFLNIPSSGFEFARNLISPILQPKETIQTLGMLTKGLVNTLIPGEDPSEEIVNDVVQFYKGRFGDIESIKRTLAEDPIGFLADTSTFLKATGGLIKGAGKLTRAPSELRKLGGIFTATGRFLDPVRLGGEAFSLIAKGTGKLGKSVTGNLLAGVGEAVPEEAFRAGKITPFFEGAKNNFREFLRGNKSLRELVDQSDSALDGVRRLRGRQYETELAKLKKLTKTVDFRPVRDGLIGQLKRFDLDPDALITAVNKISPEDLGRGNLTDEVRRVFRGSNIIDEAQMRDISQITSDVTRWGTLRADAFTVAGQDVLKKRLDGLFTPNRNSRAIVTSVRNSVKKAILKAAPEYGSLTKKYQQLTELIRELESGLGLKNNSLIQTSLSKILKLTKENNEFKLDLVREMERIGGSEIIPSIAGAVAKTFTPQSIIGKITDAGLIYTWLQGVDPSILIGALGSSPRILAEVTNVFGKLARTGQKLKPIGRAVAPFSFQAGRLGQRIVPSPQQAPLEQAQIRNK